MIVGLHLDFPSHELRAHCAARAEYHHARATWYDERVADLRGGGLDAESGMSSDPVTSLERSRDEHERKATMFALMAKHLVDAETYRLSEGDLQRVELVDRGW